MPIKVEGYAGKLYTREEVQKYRKSVATEAANIVESVLPALGDGDWSWLVEAIKGVVSEDL